jgi:transcriptional antiterminator RfaH
VRFNDRLGFMPEGFVEELRDYEEHNILRQKMALKIKLGMEVKMLDGPFQNLIAKVLALPEKDRVWLLLDIMGREVRVQHDLWSLTR